MLTFIAALYNEEKEIVDLINHIYPYVDHMIFADDGSTDETPSILAEFEDRESGWVEAIFMDHTGLPETVKAEALKKVLDGSWVLMLDADERFVDGVLPSIHDFLNSPQEAEWDYVYFRQLERVDGHVVREFQKCKLFRKEAMEFPLNDIHKDDILTGRGLVREDWIVDHRKSTTKQITREVEYLSTYKKLLAEGKIDQGRYEWLVGLHHFVRPH